MSTVTETPRTTQMPLGNPQKVGKGRFRSEESVNRYLMKHKDFEYVDGKLEKKSMPNAKHSGIATRLGAEIWYYLKKNKIGRIYNEAHFQIGEDKRIPDVAFVANERIPEDGEPEKFWDFAPDLAVEIVSPTDFYQDVLDKIDNYFEAGVLEVWLINPEKENLTVYFSFEKTKVLSKKDTLTSEKILPKFKLKLSEIFID